MEPPRAYAKPSVRVCEDARACREREQVIQGSHGRQAGHARKEVMQGTLCRAGHDRQGRLRVDVVVRPGRIQSGQRVTTCLQFGHAVPQPSVPPIQVGSGAQRSVRGPLRETSRQSLDLRVKNAPEGEVGLRPLRGKRRWLSGQMSEGLCAHRFLRVWTSVSCLTSLADAVFPGPSALKVAL